MPHGPLALSFVLLSSLAVGTPPEPAGDDAIHVDREHGDDRADGTRDHPLKSISAAIAKLAEPVERSRTIRLAGGKYESTGGAGMDDRSLALQRRMRPGVQVSIECAESERAVLAWNGGEPLVDAREGSWRLANVQIGTAASGQKRGVLASGSADVVLHSVSFQLRSQSDAAIFARRGGRIALRGAIAVNAPVPEGSETFSGVIAADHGIVEFDERAGSSLVLGDGNLSSSGYGMIRLGCETASITSRTGGNCLSIGNGGRIDLRNTATLLVATDPKNTPIGLEDDGHVLAEDARITIRGTNDSAIALQKWSTLACNDIELDGKFGRSLWASSGSTFVGSFLGDVGRLEARTGASIHVERAQGKLVGPFDASGGGLVSLPDRVVSSR